jgi:hypothetical protein
MYVHDSKRPGLKARTKALKAQAEAAKAARVEADNADALARVVAATTK